MRSGHTAIQFPASHLQRYRRAVSSISQKFGPHKNLLLNRKPAFDSVPYGRALFLSAFEKHLNIPDCNPPPVLPLNDRDLHSRRLRRFYHGQESRVALATKPYWSSQVMTPSISDELQRSRSRVSGVRAYTGGYQPAHTFTKKSRKAKNPSRLEVASPDSRSGQSLDPIDAMIVDGSRPKSASVNPSNERRQYQHWLQENSTKTPARPKTAPSSTRKLHINVHEEKTPTATTKSVQASVQENYSPFSDPFSSPKKENHENPSTYTPFAASPPDKSGTPHPSKHASSIGDQHRPSESSTSASANPVSKPAGESVDGEYSADEYGEDFES